MLLTDMNAGPVTAGGMAQAKYSNTSSHSLFSHTHRPGRCFVRILATPSESSRRGGRDSHITCTRLPRLRGCPRGTVDTSCSRSAPSKSSAGTAHRMGHHSARRISLVRTTRTQSLPSSR
jgi:hypothetical protein